MPNFCLSHKRVKVPARMRLRALRLREKGRLPRSGPRTARFRKEIWAGPAGERAKCSSRQARRLRGLQELSVMKFFAGSLAAGLALLAGSAQAQVPGHYRAVSDVETPYVVGPRVVVPPPYEAGPRYGYGPSLLPSTEVYAVLRDNGFSPLGI